MSDLAILHSDCRRCSRRTRHEVLHQLEEEISEDFFHEKDTWQIVRCMGCLSTSFRHQNDDFDDVEEDEEGNVKHAVSVNVYPRVIRNHRGLVGSHYLPSLINTIYSQTVKALSEHANVLASIGLRACIEAVCNHLEISGSNLERRIDQLYKAGHVSNGDKKRLHAIRFLGNDAAHEIKEPTTFDIRIALEIVEHLLNTVFILEKRARRLETVAETYDDFVKLLETCVERSETTNAANLLGLLGKQRRLVGQKLDDFETQLKQEIVDGKVAFLTMGQTQEVGGKLVQLYELQKENDDSDEIPF